jgi:hypothetical protein
MEEIIMSDMVDIEWNGFLKICCDNYPNESCGMLYAKTPFQITEKWFVFPVDNVAEDKTKEWQPDKKQLAKVKKKAKELGLTRIGNIHSHPFPKDAKRIDDNIEYLRHPSKMDLKYAQKFNDIVRGILVVDDKTVYGHLFHDQFGIPLPDLYLNGVNHREIVLEVTSNG